MSGILGLLTGLPREVLGLVAELMARFLGLVAELVSRFLGPFAYLVASLLRLLLAFVDRFAELLAGVCPGFLWVENVVNRSRRTGDQATQFRCQLGLETALRLDDLAPLRPIQGGRRSRLGRRVIDDHGPFCRNFDRVTT
jgi:hypothetical protein